MSRVEFIESEIRQLSAAEFAVLRDWMNREDAELWDRQFEIDVRGGRLDALFGQAEFDHRKGLTREI